MIKFFKRKLQAVKKLFTHKVYCYVIDSKSNKVLNSGFINGTWLDKNNRKWVSLKYKKENATEYEANWHNVQMPFKRLTHYRIMHNKFTLWLFNLVGIRLKNKNRRLRKFNHQ